jgi:hypothetical protein
MAAAPGSLLAGTEPELIFRLVDNGKTWQACPEVAALRDRLGWSLPYSPQAGCVRGFALHGARAYAAVEVGGVLASHDGGAIWQMAACWRRGCQICAGRPFCLR